MAKIKNIEKAAQRLKNAVEKKEKIVLYGDADLDGACSVVILEETLRELGFQKPVVYFPDKAIEGYGLNIKALDYLERKIKEKFLLVILDSGITSFKEVELAEKRGIEVMIIDHHQPLDKLPSASLIVDPKQEGDDYPFKNFANAGIVFKLSQEVFKDDFPKEKKKSFLELTALATIADMMEQTQDNEIFIREGLESLIKTKRPGLKALKEVFDKNLSIREVSQRMIFMINARDVIDHKTRSYNLLVCQTEDESRKIVQYLIEKGEERRSEIDLMMTEIEKTINHSDNVVFLSSAEWEASFLGTIASKICNKTKKPVFLIKEEKEESQGTVRAPSNVNAVDIMKEYSDLLETFGGHPPAAGFRIKNENIEKFKEKLIKHFK